MSISPNSAIVSETWDNINLSEPQFDSKFSFAIKSCDIAVDAEYLIHLIYFPFYFLLRKYLFRAMLSRRMASEVLAYESFKICTPLQV